MTRHGRMKLAGGHARRLEEKARVSPEARIKKQHVRTAGQSFPSDVTRRSSMKSNPSGYGSVQRGRVGAALALFVAASMASLPVLAQPSPMPASPVTINVVDVGGALALLQ